MKPFGHPRGFLSGILYHIAYAYAMQASYALHDEALATRDAFL